MKAPPGRFLRLLLPLCCLAISFLRAQSSSPPPATDTDGDGVPDKHDGWPRHKQLKTPPVPDSQYVVIDLGPGVTWGLNKHGDVVGFSSNNRGETEAVLWRLGKPPKYLGFFTNDKTIIRSSLATAINDDGVITGRATFSWDPVVTGEYPDPPTYPHLIGGAGHSSEHAFRYDHGAMTDLNDLSFGTPVSPDHPSGANKLPSSGSAINSFGAIVGTSAGGLSVQTMSSYWAIISDFRHPVAFTDLGGPNDLNVTPPPNSEFASLAEAVSINDHGAIAGYGAGDGRSAFFLSAGALQLIDPGYSPGGFANFGYATGMNNLDHVVGDFGVLGISALWVNNSALSPAERSIDLDAIARTKHFASSRVRAINDHDQIVGSAQSEAVLWQNGDLIRLNERIGSSPSVYLQEATGINNHGMIAANTGRRAVLLIPAELTVDGNRDGEMSLTNTAVRDKDNTTRETPFSFWVNDDQDAVSATNFSSEVVPPQYRDNQDNKIQSVRDCEDLTRLWLNLRGLSSLFTNGTLKVLLKFKNVESGDPAIRVFRSIENGGRQYLTDDAWARTQLTPPFDQGLGGTNGSTVASSTSSIYIDRQFFEGLDGNGPVIHLLFEGVQEGKGELYFELIKDGQKIADGPGVWLDLKNVKDMYERAKAQPENIAPPYDLSEPFTGPVSYISDPNGHDFRPPWDESRKCVVFVHGWNLGYDDYVSYSETMFKRLWHAGYKGHFATFRWDTRKSDGMFDAGEYNRSENRAFIYGTALKSWVKNLSVNYRVSIVGHSMGNVVCGEALRQQMRIRNYLLMEAAIPISCYDENAPTDTRLADADARHPTPDYHISPGSNDYTYGYRAYLSNIAGTLTNFFNPEDWALSTGFTFGLQTNWEKNQLDYKPDGSGSLLHDPLWAYNCDLSKALGQRAWLAGRTSRYVADSWEMKAFVARSRTKAVGAVRNDAGRFTESVNLGLPPYAFGRERPDHSGQFTRDIQTLSPLYEKMRTKIEE
jgi:hypothetical protein